MRAVGQDLEVAKDAGIDVDKVTISQMVGRTIHVYQVRIRNCPCATAQEQRKNK